MIISLKELIESSQNNNKDWLDSINVKNRIKGIIKKEKLPKEVIDFLWQKRELQLDIINHQKISEEQILMILDSYNNPRSASKVCYKQVLINQEISDDILKALHNYCVVNSAYGQYIETWGYIPDRMKKLFGFDEFLQFYRSGSVNFSTYSAILIKLCKKPGYLNDFFAYIDSKDFSYTLEGSFLISLCSSVYFDDDSILTLLRLVPQERLTEVANILISRGNCSNVSKTILLLNK